MEIENKYKNAKVYKIIADVDDSLVYIGSTTEYYLSNRIGGHRCHYRKWKSGKKESYMTSFELFEKYGIDKCKIILLEKCNVTSKDELRQREQHYIDSIDCVNHHDARKKENTKKEYKKQWAIKNKPKRDESLQKYYAKNKDKVKERSQARYYENHELNKTKRNEYYQSNKYKWKERQARNKFRKTIVTSEMMVKAKEQLHIVLNLKL